MFNDFDRYVLLASILFSFLRGGEGDDTMASDLPDKDSAALAVIPLARS